MAKKKKADSGGGGSADWLGTYADMVTLLMAFFVMLYAMSTVQEEEWEKLIMAFQSEGSESDQIVMPTEAITGDDIGQNSAASSGASGGVDEDSQSSLTFETLYEFLKQEMDKQDSSASESIEVSKGENSVYIRFNDAVLFGADSYVMTAQGIELIDFIGQALVQVDSQLQLVMVAGHTAWVDGYYPVSDWRLSGQRASSVVIHLQDEIGVPALKLQPVGHGSKYPIDTNATGEGRAKNRRVEMMILSNNADLQDPEIMDYMLKGTYDDSTYPTTGGLEDVLIPPVTPIDPETGEPIIIVPTIPDESEIPTDGSQPLGDAFGESTESGLEDYIPSPDGTVATPQEPAVTPTVPVEPTTPQVTVPVIPEGETGGLLS